MAGFPNIFANETNPVMSELDANFNFAAALGAAPCTASGTNAITMTPTSKSAQVAAYQNYALYSFVAANTSTGSVTAAIFGLSSLNVYWPDGTQVGNGGIVVDRLYVVSYNSALNSNAGGFIIVSPSKVGSTGAITAGNFAKWADAFTLQDGGTAGSYSLGLSVVTATGNLVAQSTSGIIFVTGSGGGGNRSGNTTSDLAGSGGAGATAIYVATGLTVGNNYAVTIGNAGAAGGTDGGDATIVIGATTITGGGGKGSVAGAAGTGGTATNGTINITGGSGQIVQGIASASYTAAIAGGSSFWGNQGFLNTGAGAYGSGGGGSISSGVPTTGVIGVKGVVVALWLPVA